MQTHTHTHTEAREEYNNKRVWYESERGFTRIIHSASSTCPPVSSVFTHLASVFIVKEHSEITILTPSEQPVWHSNHLDNCDTLIHRMTLLLLILLALYNASKMKIYSNVLFFCKCTFVPVTMS